MRLLADAAFERLGFDRIELRCDVDNVASARTAERAGFTFERIDPDAGVFEHVPEWAGSAPRGERSTAEIDPQVGTDERGRGLP